MANEITMYAKFNSTCVDCGYAIAKGAAIRYYPGNKTAKHVKCPEVSYDGAEQVAIFETWVQRAQEIEGSNGDKANF